MSDPNFQANTSSAELPEGGAPVGASQSSLKGQPPGQPRHPGSWAASLAGFALGTAALLFLTHRLTYFVDDAFITFRYSRNWADWGLPVFNSFELQEGFERVEGYSNLLWMALLSCLYRFGLSLETATPIVQGAIGVLTLAAVARACAGSLRLGPIAAFSGPILLATAAPFAAWATGGMETGLFTLLLTLFFLACLRPDGDKHGLRLGLLGAGLVLVRVEGAAWMIGILGACLAAEVWIGKGWAQVSRERRRWLIGFALAAAAVAFQLAYRKAVYGQWVSNTVTAKTGGAGAEVYARGLRQIASWGLVTITPIMALMALPFALRHPSQRARCLVLAACFTTMGFVLYSLITGGDWMPFFRFLAPAAPLLALVIAVGLDRLPKAAAAAAFAATVCLQPLTLFDVHVAPVGAREALRFRSFKGGYRTELARIKTARLNSGYFGRLGMALDTATEPGDVLAFGAIGSPGWYAPNLDFLDRNGLVTPVVARRQVTRREGTAGHEKRVSHAFFLDIGEPAPKWLFAKLLEGVIDGPESPYFQGAKQAIRQDAVVGRKPERELFRRTTMQLVPMDKGPAAGLTLVLLKRASPEAAATFWSQQP